MARSNHASAALRSSGTWVLLRKRRVTEGRQFTKERSETWPRGRRPAPYDAVKVQLAFWSRVHTMTDTCISSLIRVRMSLADAHYGGNLVAGAKIMELFGDAATELCIRHDGDEGLFASYDRVEFKKPVFAGDFLEIRGRITQVGRRSRKVELEAYKVIEAHPEEGPSVARVLDEPLLVARATGTVVVPKPKDS